MVVISLTGFYCALQSTMEGCAPAVTRAVQNSGNDFHYQSSASVHSQQRLEETIQGLQRLNKPKS